ncbi:MAG: helix-turn-helix transcriptional regulator [Elainellaceae cyanobacterium]
MPVTNQAPSRPTLVALPTITPSGYRGSPGDRISVDYLAVMFETIIDRIFPSQGLLLLSPSGQLIQSSPKARQLCEALDSALEAGNPHRAKAPRQESRKLPHKIAALAHRLIESRELFPEQPIQLHEDLLLENGPQVHVQAEWVHIDAQSPEYIVVTLEDSAEVAQHRALSDAYRYHFTPRETEVWQLHLQGRSYQQIADDCVISMNTVKRHMKSIYGKQRGEID